jgi:hypothetical protein
VLPRARARDLGVWVSPRRALGAPSPRCTWWRPRYAQKNLVRLARACASSPEIRNFPGAGHGTMPTYYRGMGHGARALGAVSTFYVLICIPNPLFQALSTTSRVFCDLHMAPAQFGRSRGDNFPLSSVPIWSYGIAFTWPFLDMPDFFVREG